MKDKPFPQWPRGLRRTLAAEYVGVSLHLWDKMVAEGEMPQPKRIHGRSIWDKLAVDRAFDVLDGGTATTTSGEQILEFDSTPISEWLIATRPLPVLQERAMIHMYDFRAGRFFCADSCGPKTYAALANLGLVEVIGEVTPGKMPAYRLTKLGIEKGEYLKQSGYRR